MAGTGLVITNTAPTNAYRGAGRPEAVYIVERLVDAAADRLGLDPLEIRRRNIIRPDQMPYRTLTGSVFDSGDFAGLIAKAEVASGWKSFARRRQDAARRGALRGIGCAVFLEPSGGGLFPKDQVAIRFLANNQIVLYSVAGPSGQGHETVFPELVAEILGLDAAQVVLRAGDPDGPALIGSPAIGSRTILLAHGSAYKLAAEAGDRERPRLGGRCARSVRRGCRVPGRTLWGERHRSRGHVFRNYGAMLLAVSASSRHHRRDCPSRAFSPAAHM